MLRLPLRATVRPAILAAVALLAIALTVLPSPAAGTRPTVTTQPVAGLATLDLTGIAATRRFVPTSFCSDGVVRGAPSCDARVTTLRGKSLLVTRTLRLRYRFGAPVGAAFVSFKRLVRGREEVLTRPVPLLSSSSRSGLPRLPRLRLVRGERLAVSFLVAYAAPVQLPVAGGFMGPFQNASADFEIPLRLTAGGCPRRRCAGGGAAPPTPGGR